MSLERQSPPASEAPVSGSLTSYDLFSHRRIRTVGIDELAPLSQETRTTTTVVEERARAAIE
jgi:hypothetical protein